MPRSCWDGKDDETLLRSVQKHEATNWTEISKDVGRGTESCRRRWLEHLQFSVNAGKLRVSVFDKTVGHEIKLCHLANVLRFIWSQVALILYGHSSLGNRVKTEYHRISKRKKRTVQRCTEQLSIST